MNTIFTTLFEGRFVDVADKPAKRNVRVYKSDALFYWLVIIIPIVSGLMTFYTASVSYEIWNAWSLLMGAGLTATIAVFMFPFFTIIPPDVLAGRQFIGPVRLFNDCRVFVLPRITTLVKFPGTQKVIRTSDDKTSKHSITVQLRQGQGTGKGKSDMQLVVLQIVFHLHIWEAPLTVVRAYFEEFSLHDEDEKKYEKAFKRAFKMVQDQVREVVVGAADAPLQVFTVDHILMNAADVNERLMEEPDPNDSSIGMMKLRLGQIGIAVDLITVEDVQDVSVDGYVALRSKAVRGENESETRKRVATADQKAVVAEAQARQAGQEKDIEANLAIAGWLREQLEAELENQRIRAFTDQQDAIAGIQVLTDLGAGPEAAAFAELVRRDPETAKALFQSTAEAMGVQTDGGNLTVITGDSGEKGGGTSGAVSGLTPVGIGLTLGAQLAQGVGLSGGTMPPQTSGASSAPTTPPTSGS